MQAVCCWHPRNGREVCCFLHSPDTVRSGQNGISSPRASAGLQAGEKLVDLGAGDGRVLVAAVADCGAGEAVGCAEETSGPAAQACSFVDSTCRSAGGRSIQSCVISRRGTSPLGCGRKRTAHASSAGTPAPRTSPEPTSFFCICCPRRMRSLRAKSSSLSCRAAAARAWCGGPSPLNKCSSAPADTSESASLACVLQVAHTFAVPGWTPTDVKVVDGVTLYLYRR